MTKQIFCAIVLIGILGILPSVAQESTQEAPPHWTYDEVNEWGDLSEQYELCNTGFAQSPIDLADASDINLSDIQFNYGEAALGIVNNGHTIQVNPSEGSSIFYNGIQYNLLQFHFHHPSEHTVDGVAAAMEVHFVHRDPNSGNLAVVGILFTQGQNNRAFAPIFDNLSIATSSATSIGSIDLNTLLPEGRRFMTYNGSLTTPPCSEIVRWLVMEETLNLSGSQIAAFSDLFEMNARPVQPRNGRDLLGDNG